MRIFYLLNCTFLVIGNNSTSEIVSFVDLIYKIIKTRLGYEFTPKYYLLQNKCSFKENNESFLSGDI